MAEEVHHEVLKILGDAAQREALKAPIPAVTLKEINPAFDACLEKYEKGMPKVNASGLALTHK